MISAITKSRGYSAKFSLDAENEGKKEKEEREEKEKKKGKRKKKAAKMRRARVKTRVHQLHSFCMAARSRE